MRNSVARRVSLRSFISEYLPITVLLLLAIGPAMEGQTFRGNLSGIVTDSSGAALPNAAVKLEDPLTGFVRNTVTTGAGDFQFPDLPVAKYTLTVSNPGFSVEKIENVQVEVSKTTNIPVKLSVAAQVAVVDVTAQAVTLDTTSSSLVADVNTKAVAEMPMNGRDFRQMIKLAPGVAPNNNSLNGMRTSGINYQIDGADNNDAWSNAVAVNQGGVAGIAGALVPIEAIDQFSVQSNAAADMGRNGGGNVNMVLKSGTNSLHGDLFYFVRNEALAALSPLQQPGSKKQEIRNNQFGFAAGGPIIKNKTFFFLTGEIQLAVAADSILDTAPSTAWVNAAEGVLARYNVPVNPVSLNLLSLWPSASRNGAATANNYLANALNTYNSYNGIVKIDHRFNDKHSIFIRYLGGTGTQIADVGSHFKDYFQEAPMHVHNFSVVENAVLTPRLVNQVTLGVNYFLQTFDDFNTSFNPIALGLNTGIDLGTLVGAPTMKISGFDYTGATPPLGRVDTTGHITDNLSYTVGRHQFKFGGEFRRAVLDVAYYTNERGTFSFDGSRGPWANDSTLSGTLKALADFMAGEPSNSNGATIARGNPERTYHVNSADEWVHDTFQVTPTLSVNFGVRYTYQGVLHDTTNDLTNFIPGEGFKTGQLYPKDLTDFAPRFGFAYSPGKGGKTVVRGGYGIYYDVPTVGSFVYNVPGNGGASGIYSNPAGPSPVYSLTASNVVFQSGVPVFGNSAANPPFGVYAVSQSFKTPYVQNFNLNIEHQLTSSTLFTVAYVGSLGRRLEVVEDINQKVNGVRPYAAEYPTLGTINQLNTAANSNYNSFQATLRQQLTHGLTANLNYTFGKALDDASSATTPANSYNLRNDYGPATFDTRNSLTGFVSYTVPKFTAFAPRLTNGWQINALITVASGNPVNIMAGTNVSGTGENKDRVNVIGDPYATNSTIAGSLAQQYLVKSAFAVPAAGTFGDLGRDIIYGPDFGALDFSIFKHTPITERINSEFRVEIFNLTNKTNWANPTATYTSASFGELTQTRNGSSAPGLGFGEPRNIQLALKLIF
ncbi:MAG TPA: TonB-dependent receptor [Bryobacteraceae bacterium]|nr:TonB-dependent receptor [Bryobacteraceae bacterium]